MEGNTRRSWSEEEVKVRRHQQRRRGKSGRNTIAVKTAMKERRKVERRVTTSINELCEVKR